MVNYEPVPDTCPVCRHAMHPTSVAGPGLVPDPKVAGHYALEIPYRCPRTACGAFFIARYHSHPGHPYSLHSLVPQTPVPAVVEPAIAKLSPSFVKIYNQAFTAEAGGLDEIAGVGFRKALEFLIKDYCVSKHPNETDQIKKSFLGACIKNLVSDPNVKRCAERATWLGNDETHYVRVWDAHDISDLKTLIRLTVNWITNELLTEEYFSSMPKPTHDA